MIFLLLLLLFFLPEDFIEVELKSTLIFLGFWVFCSSSDQAALPPGFLNISIGYAKLIPTAPAEQRLRLAGTQEALSMQLTAHPCRVTRGAQNVLHKTPEQESCSSASRWQDKHCPCDRDLGKDGKSQTKHLKGARVGDTVVGLQLYLEVGFNSSRI